MSKYGVFFGPYFPVFGLNAEIYSVNLAFSSNTRKNGPEKTPDLDNFHTLFLCDTLFCDLFIKDLYKRL